MKTVSFEKKKKNSIKKQITGIECKGKNLLHCRKSLNVYTAKIEIIIKFEIISITQINIEVLRSRIYNLKYNIPNDIPVVFCSGLNNDYHFIIKQSENDL